MCVHVCMFLCVRVCVHVCECKGQRSMLDVLGHSPPYFLRLDLLTEPRLADLAVNSVILHGIGLFKFSISLKISYVCLCVRMWVSVCICVQACTYNIWNTMYVEVRGQLSGVGSYLSPFEVVSTAVL